MFAPLQTAQTCAHWWQNVWIWEDYHCSVVECITGLNGENQSKRRWGDRALSLLLREKFCFTLWKTLNLPDKIRFFQHFCHYLLFQLTYYSCFCGMTNGCGWNPPWVTKQSQRRKEKHVSYFYSAQYRRNICITKFANTVLKVASVFGFTYLLIHGDKNMTANCSIWYWNPHDAFTGLVLV